MGQKILSQAGISLADIYDVEGSIVDVGELETHEIQGVHELGQTIFSERVGGILRREVSAATAQNLDITLRVSDLPSVPHRLLGIQVFADVSGRLSQFAVMVNNVEGTPGTSVEMPIWMWDSATGTFVTVRLSINGASSGNVEFLEPANGSNVRLPTMLFGSQQPDSVDRIIAKGLTSGFGAGTVTVELLMYFARAEIGGVSSFGLPVPSW